jgi:hypothetical protein
MDNYKCLAVMLVAASLANPSLIHAGVAMDKVDRQSVVQQNGADPSTAEQEMFLQAQRLYEKNQFDQSVKMLQELLVKYPQSAITDLTLLWLARSYIGLNNLSEAERVGGQLRQIKDTPFLEIYQMELSDALRKAGIPIAVNSTSETPANADRPRVAANAEPPSQRASAAQEANNSQAPRPIIANLTSSSDVPSTGSQTSKNTEAPAASQNRRSSKGSRRGDLSGARRIIRVEPDGTTTTTSVPSVAANTTANNRMNSSRENNTRESNTSGELKRQSTGVCLRRLRRATMQLATILMTHRKPRPAILRIRNRRQRSKA